MKDDTHTNTESRIKVRVRVDRAGVPYCDERLLAANGFRGALVPLSSLAYLNTFLLIY